MPVSLSALSVSPMLLFSLLVWSVVLRTLHRLALKCNCTAMCNIRYPNQLHPCNRVPPINSCFTTEAITCFFSPPFLAQYNVWPQMMNGWDESRRIVHFFFLPHSLTLSLSLFLSLSPLSCTTNGTHEPRRISCVDTTAKEEHQRKVSTLDAFLDLIRNMFPENLIQACFEQIETSYKKVIEVKKGYNASLPISSLPPGSYDVTYKRQYAYKAGTNVLGLIVFCTAFGIICGQLGEEGDLMVKFFVILNEIIMRIVIIVMWYSPIGIASLIIGKLMAIEDLAKTAAQLGLYMVTVILGLVIHAGITLPLIYFGTTRKNPLTFFKGTILITATTRQRHEMKLLFISLFLSLLPSSTRCPASTRCASFTCCASFTWEENWSKSILTSLQSPFPLYPLFHFSLWLSL